MKGCLLIIRALFLLIFFFGSLTQGNSQDHTKISSNQQALNKALEAKNYKEASVYSYEIAKLYWDANKLNEAITSLDQTLTYGKKASNNLTLYAAYETRGLIYTEQKNYSKALSDFQDAAKTAHLLGNKTYECENLISVAESNASLNRHKKAIDPLEQALSLSLDQKNKELQLKCYALLIEYNKKLGDVKKANEYQNQYNLITFTEEKENNAREIKELKKQSQRSKELSNRMMKELRSHIDEVELEKLATESELMEQSARLRQTEDSLRMVAEISQKRQLEIDLLNKDKELAGMKIKEQNARLENERLVRNSIIVGALLAAALVVVIIINYRKTLKVNKKMKQQNENIKSSINYAKRIQEAMLPRKDHNPAWEGADSFVLFKPRDVVSGDFYWFSEIQNGHDSKTRNDLAFAAVDCTGHGVPGAFMSMIGINSLNGIINRGITETNSILDTLSVEIRTALRQEVTGNNDGMDVALCVYRKSKSILEFSGAKSPLVYIQDNELRQIKGDIHHIGGSRNKKRAPFKKHEIKIDRPTTIYLFSDGYKDQFGGESNMKFMSKQFTQLLLEIHRKPMKEQMQFLDKTIENWKGASTQTDDILVMGIRLDPANV